MTFTLYLSLGLLATSFAFLIQSIIIFYIEEKFIKITVNHHGRIKNLEEKQVNSWENIHDEIANNFWESGKKSEVYEK